MEKLVYVLWRRPDVSAGEFAAGLLGDVAKRFLDLGVHGLGVNIADAAVAGKAASRITHLDPSFEAVVSFWLDLADERAPYEEVLGTLASRLAGYLVVESVPLVNSTRRAAPGERTPGINMLACIERPERLSWDAWIDHWHGHHKRVALETQCTYAYVRNVVVRSLTADAPPWSGIVEEGFPTEAVGDPMVWYAADGDAEVLQRNIARMVESCQAFLDLDRVESHPMSEYRLKEVGR